MEEGVGEPSRAGARVDCSAWLILRRFDRGCSERGGGANGTGLGGAVAVERARRADSVGGGGRGAFRPGRSLSVQQVS